MLAFPMAPIIVLVLLANLLAKPLSLTAQSENPASRITVVGVVFCDTCSTNTFSRHSYFLPGADVHLQCKFKANSPEATEQIEFSVNRTTGRYGTYKLEIPQVDGVDCVDGLAIQSVCQASLIGSSSPSCNVPALKISTNEISVKSKQDNLCIYSLNALSYRPSKRNVTLCGNHKEELFNSSKFFLPYFPPFGFPWPPLPNLPPLPPLPPLPSLPPLPPLPSLPFPPFPSLPFPPLPPFPSFPFPHFTPPSPPSLPFPFPPLPPFPPTPALFHPPPPPAFNLGDPRTWTPNIPSLTPPPSPPAFNLKDPRTWVPYIPPSSPNSPQIQNP